MKRIKYEQQKTYIQHNLLFFFIQVAYICPWLLLLSSTQNSSETISNSVFHVIFSGIIVLHGCFLKNLLYYLMSKFFEEYLKATSESVSLFSDRKSIYCRRITGQAVRVINQQYALFFPKTQNFYASTPVFRPKLTRTKQLIDFGLRIHETCKFRRKNSEKWYMQSFPYENHCECHKKLAQILTHTIFTYLFFFL